MFMYVCLFTYDTVCTKLQNYTNVQIQCTYVFVDLQYYHVRVLLIIEHTRHFIEKKYL